MAASSRGAIILLLWAWPSQAHDVISTKITWTQEISRIVYSHCSRCHRDGGTAPMALISYRQVRPWAKAIKEEVHERRMPPWGAMKGFGEFRGDNSLSAEEIHLIADWVEGGAPEGDPQYLPPAVTHHATVAPVSANLLIRDGYRVPGSVVLFAVSPPPGLTAGSSLQAVAVLPDGVSIPLLWLYNFQPKHSRTYPYREPVRLPAGTTIRIIGAPSLRVRTTR